MQIYMFQSLISSPLTPLEWDAVIYCQIKVWICYFAFVAFKN